MSDINHNNGIAMNIKNYPYNELPKVGDHGKAKRKGSADTIIPGFLNWKNDSHPAWRSGDYWEYSCHNSRTGQDYIFRFHYVNCGNYYEIDILEYPDCMGKSENSPSLHWLNSARGGKKICVNSGQEPRTLEQAKSLSESWAVYVARYIWTGMSIDYQISHHIW